MWSEGGLLAPGTTSRAFPARAAMPVAAACGRVRGLPRSQWRVRAGFAPASLSTDLVVGRHAIPPRGHDRQPHADLHAARRRRRDAPRRHEPRAEDGPADRGVRDGRRAQRRSRGRARRRRPARALRRRGCARIQNDLFDVGADLSVPPGGDRTAPARGGRSRPRGWRRRCDEVNAELPSLRRSCSRAARPPPRSCTSAGPCAGGRSGARSRAATPSAPSACATSTACRTSCSSSRAAPRTAARGAAVGAGPLPVTERGCSRLSTGRCGSSTGGGASSPATGTGWPGTWAANPRRCCARRRRHAGDAPRARRPHRRPQPARRAGGAGRRRGSSRTCGAPPTSCSSATRRSGERCSRRPTSRILLAYLAELATARGDADLASWSAPGRPHAGARGRRPRRRGRRGPLPRAGRRARARLTAGARGSLLAAGLGTVGEAIDASVVGRAVRRRRGA